MHQKKRFILYCSQQQDCRFRSDATFGENEGDMYQVCTDTGLDVVCMTIVYDALTHSDVSHRKGYITQVDEQVISGPNRSIAECSVEHSLSSASYMVKQHLDRVKVTEEKAPAFIDRA